ncbi:DUF4760 domain-containing protein [Martelella endophytica]|uniref:DUF4760 domain-containing protein n=1 Tax=Martelella endophytica TaxID=1486262 RepID=A0A0D5LS89_MAREN|nr:hypothetical protein [Martelella endophytica]AJY46830.1 hypothetical protein TM49_15975 [Martelella endophytica]
MENNERLLGIAHWRWSLLSNVITVLGALSVVFAVYQYSATIEANRAEKTLEMIVEWRDAGYRADFLSLRQSLMTTIEEMSADGRSAERRRDDIVSRSLARDGVDSAFDNVIYYFNLLGLCVEANLCSDETARVFFDDTLENFLQFFGPEIIARRDALPGYGEGVDCLARAFRLEGFRRASCG